MYQSYFPVDWPLCHFVSIYTCNSVLLGAFMSENLKQDRRAGYARCIPQTQIRTLLLLLWW